MDKYQENKLVEEAQKQAELFVKNNYEDVDEVTIKKDNYKFYPADLGGLSIIGYVNGDKSLFFSVDFEQRIIKLAMQLLYLNQMTFYP